MAEHSYRAYISYSHSDEVWAAWLQRALELYRVPRNLVGNETDAGRVPARIRPVLRDREDLSSAVDLEVTVKQALTNSENMIVICSPEAVASRWVNEEIPEFAALGRADRIFCIIVDGEPVGDCSLSVCFPTALAEIGQQEPLAADVRKWADGKLDSAKKSIESAILIVQQLAAADPSNVHYRELLLGRQTMLLTLLVDTGQLKSANQYLQSAIRLQLEQADPNEKDIFEAYRLVRARYLLWQLNGVDDIDHFLIMPNFKQASSNSFRSCTEVDTAARIYVIEGDGANAASQVQYLESRGYADPGFIRSCEQSALCKS